MKFSILLSMVIAAGVSSAVAHVADAQEAQEDAGLFRRWGSGKYKIDDDTYHRIVKPHFLSVFGAMPSFKGLCGSNPDFFVERDGTVYPSAVESKAKKAGKCTKSKYSADMSEYLTEILTPKPKPN